ncbi:Uncharacterised protein [Nocardia otitidiscaviarum]|uniref:Uncharacterized protein n=1 Tax=Nocardia otitidiscaviarum TaxID=1823 RepID=A0A379JHU9_9NOCA|nr:hypothetical protein [Nocardia otitidiscaviarum]MBF6177258.1 hypothetical protein [Nocardia otitidiscaviarum]MCP9625290.1 hypothetical protein [Nocardia otitidiscaviarum]QDP78617.1 hypothetical protein FOH10_07545 [Nocardia otitidiscaviarum]SUD47936.1 Uncharacterised protein [Nocardia otitidiscaviarum]
MTATETTRRPSTAARRAGYVVAALCNAVLLYAIHAWPGWDALPFLTEDTPRVLWLVTASLIAGLITSVVYLPADPPWLKSLGDLVTTGIGLAATIRVWQVFPFDFGSATFDWALVFRILLAIAIAGAVVGMIVQLFTFLRAVIP